MLCSGSPRQHPLAGYFVSPAQSCVDKRMGQAFNPLRKPNEEAKKLKAEIRKSLTEKEAAAESETPHARSQCQLMNERTGQKQPLTLQFIWK